MKEFGVEPSTGASGLGSAYGNVILIPVSDLPTYIHMLMRLVRRDTRGESMYGGRGVSTFFRNPADRHATPLRSSHDEDDTLNHHDHENDPNV